MFGDSEEQMLFTFGTDGVRESKFKDPLDLCAGESLKERGNVEFLTRFGRRRRRGAHGEMGTGSGGRGFEGAKIVTDVRFCNGYCWRLLKVIGVGFRGVLPYICYDVIQPSRLH